ncbi:hypothetical protein [Streptomyces sp. NPDC058812]|uniref:hypothetical protein n=1 Tax=unclassified Streptomyces TaxID=2593676 RepID=UPI0036BB44A1
MTNTTNSHQTGQNRPSRFRAAPLPDAPRAVADWPDRASRVRDQQEALAALVREDLSRARALTFLVCAVVVTFVAGVVPVMVVDAAEAEGSETTDVAVSLVLGLVLLAVLALPASAVLRGLRRRSSRRFTLMRQWAAVERGHDAEFPTQYGVQGYPHGRFFYAAVMLVLVVVLSVAVLADVSDPKVLALLPCLVVAGLLAWSTARKYAGRYGWSTRERLERIRARRQQQRARLGQGPTAAGGTVTRPPGVHPALIYAALLAPTVIVTLVFVVVRPKEALSLAVAAALAAAVLALGLPKVLLTRRRERTELDVAARALTSSFPPGTAVHPVRYGLAETHPGAADTAGPSSWDAGPSRTGALAVDGGALRLRGTDGAALDVSLGEVEGVILTPSGVAWAADSVDVLLRSGEAIEFRSPRAGSIVDTLAGAGVQVLEP